MHYPIVARDHEMVSTIALVPKRVLACHDVYIIVKDSVEACPVKIGRRSNGLVDVVDDVSN